jgi:hypothetical protein
MPTLPDRAFPKRDLGGMTPSHAINRTSMHQNLSDPEYHIRRPPHPRSCFFKQTVLEGQIGDDLFQSLSLPAQALHLVGGGRARRVAGEPALAGLQERPINNNCDQP